MGTGACGAQRGWPCRLRTRHTDLRLEDSAQPRWVHPGPAVSAAPAEGPQGQASGPAVPPAGFLAEAPRARGHGRPWKTLTSLHPRNSAPGRSGL